MTAGCRDSLSLGRHRQLVPLGLFSIVFTSPIFLSSARSLRDGSSRTSSAVNAMIRERAPTSELPFCEAHHELSPLSEANSWQKHKE